jgi:hypothetical protein
VVRAIALVALATPAVRAAGAGPPAQELSDLRTDVADVAGQVSTAQAQKPPPAPGSASLPPGLVEIDGAKHPELLPEYLVWTHGLSALSAIKKDNITAALETLPLSPRDADLAFAEGVRQDDRDRRCGERTRRIMESLRTAAPAKIEAALRPAILDCRWEVLDAKDRLLAAMSPEGRATLVAWVLDGRQGIKSYVPKGDLEFYRQPK